MHKAVHCALAALAAAALVLGADQRAEAGPMNKDFGAGIVLGAPSGLTAKQWLSVSQAVDFHLSFDFGDEYFVFHSNYLLHFDIARVGTNAVELPLYIGIGGKLFFDANDKDNKSRGDDDAFGIGARIPLGISVLLRKAPLEFFFEIAPGISVLPRTDPEFDGGLGIRYYF